MQIGSRVDWRPRGVSGLCVSSRLAGTLHTVVTGSAIAWAEATCLVSASSIETQGNHSTGRMRRTKEMGHESKIETKWTIS